MIVLLTVVAFFSVATVIVVALATLAASNRRLTHALAHEAAQKAEAVRRLGEAQAALRLLAAKHYAKLDAVERTELDLAIINIEKELP